MSDYLNELQQLIARGEAFCNKAKSNVEITKDIDYKIWTADVQRFHNSFLQKHALFQKIKNALFFDNSDTLLEIMACLKSILAETNTNSTQEESLKDFEMLLKKLIPIARKDDWSVMKYDIQLGERPLFKALQDMGLITNVRYMGMKYVGFDFTYDGYHYFDEAHETPVPHKASLPKRKYDVFLSHASADKNSYVEELKQTLDILGIDVFYDKDTIEWGDEWKKKIYEGLEKSEFAIIVISKNFFGREWTELELQNLLNRQNAEGQKLILPILHGVTADQLKEKYPAVADIQAIDSSNYSKEHIGLLFAKQLIKRYKSP